jgi:hypothetical protein
MTYYRSTAYIISQGFKKVLICYFWSFLAWDINFQRFSQNLHKRKRKNKKENTFASRPLEFLEINPCSACTVRYCSHESWISQLDPSKSFYLHFDTSSSLDRAEQRSRRWGDGARAAREGRSTWPWLAVARARQQLAAAWAEVAPGLLAMATVAAAAAGSGRLCRPTATSGSDGSRTWRGGRSSKRWWLQRRRSGGKAAPAALYSCSTSVASETKTESGQGGRASEGESGRERALGSPKWRAGRRGMHAGERERPHDSGAAGGRPQHSYTDSKNWRAANTTSNKPLKLYFLPSISLIPISYLSNQTHDVIELYEYNNFD